MLSQVYVIDQNSENIQDTSLQHILSREHFMVYN